MAAKYSAGLSALILGKKLYALQGCITWEDSID